MTREEFDRDHAQGFCNGGVLFPWCLLTWKERIVRIVMTILMVAVFLAMLVSMLAVVGMVIDGEAERATELSRCQKYAATPYDYHRCK